MRQEKRTYLLIADLIYLFAALREKYRRVRPVFGSLARGKPTLFGCALYAILRTLNRNRKSGIAHYDYRNVVDVLQHPTLNL